MVTIVKTIATKIEDAYRHIKVQVMGKNDIQTPAEVAPYGIDSNPVKDLAAVYAPSTVSGEPVLIGYLLKNRLADVGELRMYATDDAGAEQNYMWLRADGTIEIGGDDDNMVRYSELETAFNRLKADLDDLVEKHNTLLTNFNTLGTNYLAHQHTVTAPTLPTTPGIPAAVFAPSTASGSPSTADITPAKIDEIKTS
jgi:hypothetical protein